MARWRTLASRAQQQPLRVRLVVFVLVWNAALLPGTLLGLAHPLWPAFMAVGGCLLIVFRGTVAETGAMMARHVPGTIPRSESGWRSFVWFLGGIFVVFGVVTTVGSLLSN